MNAAPENRLVAVLKKYPDTGKHIDTFRASRGVDLPQWPDWCFLPMAAFYSVISEHRGTSRLSPLDAKDIGVLTALGTWRYSQGIYRFHDDLMAALIDSDLNGKLPCDVLRHLPEWCIYIETPSLTWLGSPLLGFWAHLEWDVNTQQSELRLVLNLESDLVALPLHLGDWPVAEALDRAISVANTHGLSSQVNVPANATALLASEITPLISCLLYLCSDAPEIDDLRSPGEHPKRPQPVKTKRGWRLFPVAKPRRWNVGASIGESLHIAKAGDPTGRNVKTHLRRGHWHGYWTGKRNTNEQRFIYKWISPLVVGAR